MTRKNQSCQNIIKRINKELAAKLVVYFITLRCFLSLNGFSYHSPKLSKVGLSESIVCCITSGKSCCPDFGAKWDIWYDNGCLLTTYTAQMSQSSRFFSWLNFKTFLKPINLLFPSLLLSRRCKYVFMRSRPKESISKIRINSFIFYHHKMFKKR